jgi:YHS domain-containing protein
LSYGALGEALPVMVRTVVYLIVAIFLITLVRAVVGLIGKAFGQLFQPSSPQRPSSGAASRASFGGELKKDPVCGVFVSTATALKKQVGDQVYYFCSPQCRDKFHG